MANIKIIGRYEVKSEIAKGGMSTVYHAYDPRFERDVAIKLLPSVFLHDPQFRVRFEREAKMIALLEHPAIVPVYDFGEEESQPYIVMRYMSGGSLTERLREGPISPTETAQMISRLAPALDAAHARNIIHRDLKPGNILFDQYGNAYLSDFGIARLAEGGGLTLTGESILGTPGYMSPEQVQGDKALDGRSDLYSLGVLIYQMLTGQMPYQADTPAKLMMMHVLQPIPNIMEAMAELPPECEEIIAKSMAKKPEDRYATTTELAAALEGAAHGIAGAAPLSSGAATLIGDKSLQPDYQMSTVVTPGKTVISRPKKGVPPPPVAAPPGKAVPAARPRRSGLAVAIPVVVILFLILVIAGGLALTGTRGKGPLAFLGPPTATTTPTSTAVIIPPTPTVPVPTDTLSPSETPTEIPPSPTPTETVPPTPSSAVIGGADKVAYLNGKEIWVANVDGSEVIQLTDDRTVKNNLQWTPDGQAVNYISGKCIYSVFLSDKHKEMIVCFNFTDYLKSFEISPDAKQIALSLDNQLYLLPNDLDLVRSVSVKADLTKIAECKDFAPYLKNYVKFPRWSKDSKKLAMVIFAVATGLGSVDAIQVIPIDECNPDPRALDNFPPPRFTPEEYRLAPRMPNFGWDGLDLFAFATWMRNEGFGNLYVYNMDLKKGTKPINPVGDCCYRDPIWSPDGSHLLFAFQKWPGGDGSIQLFYIPFGTLGTGVEYFPLPIPPIEGRSEPQPALRPFP